MDARERWQALQARLTAARAAADHGDRSTALAEVSAALELDPEFLAAHSLRDRILALPSDPPGLTAPPALREHAAPSHLAPTPLASAHLAPAGAPSSYAGFEQRARRRRVDRRIDAARAAIQQQALKAAAAALDEVIDLDPNLPELAELTAEFDTLRRAVATPRRGPWLAAAAVFAVAMFGGSWLQDSAPILSRQIVSAAPLPAPMTPIVTVSERFETAGTAGVRTPAPASNAGGAAAAIEEAALVPGALPGDETMLVTQTLLGYRWNTDVAAGPIGFDNCDPRVDGDAATAVCHAGPGEWSVTLRKTGTSWKIETARER